MYGADDLTIRDLLSLTVRDPAAAELLAIFPTIKDLAEATPRN